MLFCLSARIRSFTDHLRNAWFLLVVVPVLFALAGCGGNPATPLQSQAPLLTPAAPSDPPPSTGSGSSGSGSASSGSSTPSSPPSSSPTTGSSSPPAAPGVPPGAQVMSAVQTLPNWQWCTKDLNGPVCAAGLGNATSSMTPSQQTPSLSGESAKFKIGGPTQYSNALWWKSFGANSTPKHFAYDVY